MLNDISSYILTLVGQTCCRKRVGRARSLSVGFGRKLYHHKTDLADPFYGEWEIGSYLGSWRIVQDGRIILASSDALDSISDFNKQLAKLEFGRFQSLSQPTDFDVRIQTDCGYAIDFLAATSEEDESFHVFGPSALYIQFSPLVGWKIGKSNQPWRDGPSEPH